MRMMWADTGFRLGRSKYILLNIIIQNIFTIINYYLKYEKHDFLL